MNRPEIIAQYLSFDSGNICDAMDQLGLQRSAIQGLQPLIPQQQKAVGFARTVKQIRKQAGKDTGKARHSVFIDETLEPGDLIVIDTNGVTDACTGGSILALRAKMRGAVGELTNGCLRDVEDFARLDFPAWYAGPCPVRSAEDLQTIGTDCPVVLGGVQICMGDLVFMDSSGVVVVPAEQIRIVAARAADICSREAKIIELIRQGHSLADARQYSGPVG